MAALTLLQKHIHQRDIAGLLDRLAAILIAGHLTGQQRISLINYLLLVGESANAKAFVRQLAQRVPQHGEEMMTIAQQLEQSGIKKGRRQGKREGKLEGKLEVARNLLQSGMPIEAVKTLTGLTGRQLDGING